MNRENIALVARARLDPIAMTEVGRRYLAGHNGFPRHERLGLEYLGHPSVRNSAEVKRIICEHLDVERIVELGYEAHLLRSASEGSPSAQTKLGLIYLLTRGTDTGVAWLVRAAASGSAFAEQVLATTRLGGTDRLLPVLVAHTESRIVPLAQVIGRLASESGDSATLSRCIAVATQCSVAARQPVAKLVASLVDIAVRSRLSDLGLPTQEVEACLETLAAEGDRAASHWLGRAYSGFSVCSLHHSVFVQATNLRKGVALLLRAADRGESDAWLVLYALHREPHNSLSNPQLARFFLEKAAATGSARAKRMLGATIMRGATSAEDAEQAIAWLSRAAADQDGPASALLKSLRLYPSGPESQACAIIDRVRAVDPMLAMRLRLSRDFGLTKLEALCVDPAAARRPWGLFIDRNPFIEHAKRAEPRAVRKRPPSTRLAQLGQ